MVVCLHVPFVCGIFLSLSFFFFFFCNGIVWYVDICLCVFTYSQLCVYLVKLLCGYVPVVCGRFCHLEGELEEQHNMNQSILYNHGTADSLSYHNVLAMLTDDFDT